MKFPRLTTLLSFAIAVDPQHRHQSGANSSARWKAALSWESAMRCSKQVVFDDSRITTNDWISYRILNMSDISEIKLVLINNPKVGPMAEARRQRMHWLRLRQQLLSTMQLEKSMRQLPMKSAYVQEFLKIKREV